MYDSARHSVSTPLTDLHVTVNPAAASVTAYHGCLVHLYVSRRSFSTYARMFGMYTCLHIHILVVAMSLSCRNFHTA